MTATTRLKLLAFPQGWTGSELRIRIMVVPSGNPMQPLDTGLTPFAQAQLELEAKLIPGGEQLPTPADVTETVALSVPSPAGTPQLYSELADTFGVDPSAPAAYVPPTKTRFLKMLMPSYLQASGQPPRTEYAVTDNRYLCELADGERPNRPSKPPQPPKWNALLAMALRQPVLAERLGLVYTTSATPSDPAFFTGGGWIYVNLAATSDYFTQTQGPGDFVTRYAARIPPLRAHEPTPVFAAVLFPVRDTPPSGSFDEMMHEAERYTDGHARLVHTFQADRMDYLNLSKQGDRRTRPQVETGLRIGWDDEQIVIWLNRQLTDDPRNGSPSARDTPMGVRGYRIDVREAGAASPWSSLVRMHGPITVGNLAIGHFDAEMAVELAPSQLQGKRDGDYWLPPYFTTWAGGSVIAYDELGFKLSNASATPRILRPVGHHDVVLKYGKQYQFRVRLTDLTGGGPGPDAADGPPDTVALTRFRRYVPPGSLLAEALDEDGEPATFLIPRPPLGYPALLFTQATDASAHLLDDLPTAHSQGRPPGYPDPDVERLRIDVTVASLDFDPGNLDGPLPRRHLYTCFRAFPADPEEAFELTVDFVDVSDITDFPTPTTIGPVTVPTGRTADLILTAIARRDPGMPTQLADPLTAEYLETGRLDDEQPKFVYFANHAARLGKDHQITVRRETNDEPQLLDDHPAVAFQGIFMQPDPPNDPSRNDVDRAAGVQEQAVGNPVERLGRSLRLVPRDLTLSGQPGNRVVFGASAAIRHLLSPDNSTITFIDRSELTARWIIAVPLIVQRDWTWDGLADEGFQVHRRIGDGASELVGTASPRHALSATAVRSGVALVRSQTQLFFFDAIDPKPAPGQFPRELTVEYTVTPILRSAPASPPTAWTGSLDLPIAAKPTQVPHIVSAGIALSPYTRDERYSRTSQRQRMLWVEFAEPIANPRDSYFARVTMHAADPMLTDEEPVPPPGPFGSPINLDPEPIRSITANQPTDASGLDAMQALIPADADGPVRHFLIPLPEQLSDASSELLGFFTYEFAVGHAEGWSTAQARFGPVQRVTGVQHPAPALACGVVRVPEHIVVTAPFAGATTAGRTVRAEIPRSELWALLYVQVRLADRSDWRNVLIGRTRLRFTDHGSRGRRAPESAGIGYLDQGQIELWLEVLGVPLNSPLSVLTVELLPEPDSPFDDPIGIDLGHVRVIRHSTLTPVPAICLDV
ncbi:hypothetical protein ACFWBG_11530 [Nocardia salmonicida]|uniref:hypothetical protein n=1 Tax=Nocardia salmonicida TaxID=53431 RepID=UPI0036703D47